MEPAILGVYHLQTQFLRSISRLQEQHQPGYRKYRLAVIKPKAGTLLPAFLLTWTISAELQLRWQGATSTPGICDRNC
jgi:hypothetical protein